MTQSHKKLLIFLTTVLFFLVPAVRSVLLAGLCALLLSALANQPIRALEKRGVPRLLGVLLLYSAGLAAAAALFWILFSWLCRETNSLLRLFGEVDPLWERLEAFSGNLPDGMRQLALRGILLLEAKWTSLRQQLTQRIAEWSAAIAAALPGKLLFLLIVLLASIFASVDWPQLRRHGQKLLPDQWAEMFRVWGNLLKSGLLSWLSTQGKLLAVQFVLLFTGLLAAGIQRAPLCAALISLADALPLLGAGSILLPWALMAFLNGRTARCFWLCALAFLLWAVRTVLEPRLLGKQTQLSSFYTILALYLGLRCFGLWGAIAAPILLTVGTQLLHFPREPPRH